MTSLLYIIISTTIISSCSLLGVLSLSANKEKLQKTLAYLVSFAAGTLIGSAFLHLIPEATLVIQSANINLVVIASFSFFFLVEKMFHWHHHHDVVADPHTVGYLNLLIDALHNFVDGLVIAAAFIVSFELGIATSIAVIMHEIPQEISDFSVLIHSGFNFKQALKANFIVALTALLGGVVGYLFYGYFNTFIPIVMSFAAGGFIYISATDLIPELKQEKDIAKSWGTFFMFVLGVGLMYVL